MSPPQKHREKEQIVIRSWPKVIFLYPVMAAALICGITQLFLSDSSQRAGDAAVVEIVEGEGAVEEDSVRPRDVVGLFFFAVFALNLLVISFDFGRFRTISILFAVVAVIFFLLYLSHYYDVLPWLKDLLMGLRISASTSFYFGLVVYLAVVFVVVYIMTRFNYWVIRRNEILHKEGFLGDVRRFPSPNLRMSKEISDVFEFILLGSGRVVLSPASEKQSIVLDHVLRVNRAEREIQNLLSSLSVDITPYADDDAAEEGIGG